MFKKQTGKWVSLLFFALLWQAREAGAYGGVSSLSYNPQYDQLSGYTATWKDWWDGDYSDCLYWDYDWEYEQWYCASWGYWQNSVAVNGYVYAPSGSTYASGSMWGWSYAELDLNPFQPSENGTWTMTGNHYQVQDFYISDGWYWYYAGTWTNYLGSTSAQASNSCGDGDLDALLGEYRYYAVQPRPSCADFKNIPRGAVVSRYFTWGDFNHPEDNPHNWAIVSGRTLAGVDTTQDLYGDGLRITSGYRSPGTTRGGSFYHMWGRAADQKAYWWPAGTVNYNVWYPLYNNAWAAGAEWVEPYDYDPPSSRTHVHSQWPYGY